jgi:hypothetical protein
MGRRACATTGFTAEAGRPRVLARPRPPPRGTAGARPQPRGPVRRARIGEPGTPRIGPLRRAWGPNG